MNNKIFIPPSPSSPSKRSIKQRQYTSNRQKANRKGWAIAVARVLGPKNATTPGGLRAACIHSKPFEAAKTSPITAIAEAAATYHGIVPHEPNWRVHAVYRVRDHAPGNFEHLVVCEFIPERAIRAQRRWIHDRHIDPMADYPTDNYEKIV
jgi:hypothetical protein